MTGSNKLPGFTLIELLIVASVFSLLFLVATTAFVNIQSYQRGILARQRVAADGRYLVEAMARSVRLGSVDYAYYKSLGVSSLTGEQDRLVVRDQLGQGTCYWLNGSKIFVGSDCTSGDSLTPDDLIVENFYVRVQPASNPYAPPPAGVSDCNASSGPGLGYQSAQGVCRCNVVTDCFPDQQCVLVGTNESICQNANLQPSVSIVIVTRSTNTRPGEQARITLETTVTSRTYGQP